MNDIIWFEQELDIPIRFILLNSANIYIGDVEISKISDVKKYIGSRKGYKYPKLSYQGFRQLLLNQRI